MGILSVQYSIAGSSRAIQRHAPAKTVPVHHFPGIPLVVPPRASSRLRLRRVSAMVVAWRGIAITAGAPHASCGVLHLFPATASGTVESENGRLFRISVRERVLSSIES